MNDPDRSGRGCELRRSPAPAIVAIGASTGGPQALVALLSKLAPVLRHGVGSCPPLPACVTLHMPRDLMPVIAAHVARRCGIATSIVDAPCRLGGGAVYFAPGDRHLGFHQGRDGVDLLPVASLPAPLLALPLAPRRKSAVDAMFSGVASVFGARAVGIILSGMGEDGLAGARILVDRGGIVLAQDRASSAVWGMPGAVVQAGLASRALPPADLAAEVIDRLAARRPAAAPSRVDGARVRAGHPAAEARR